VRFCATFVAPNDLVLRRREAASKDAPGGGDEATSWNILRDSMLRIAPQDEVGVAHFSAPFLLSFISRRETKRFAWRSLSL
jgi:hypothetical protein